MKSEAVLEVGEAALTDPVVTVERDVAAVVFLTPAGSVPDLCPAELAVVMPASPMAGRPDRPADRRALEQLPELLLLPVQAPVVVYKHLPRLAQCD